RLQIARKRSVIPPWTKLPGRRYFSHCISPGGAPSLGAGGCRVPANADRASCRIMISGENGKILHPFHFEAPAGLPASAEFALATGRFFLRGPAADRVISLFGNRSLR